MDVVNGLSFDEWRAMVDVWIGHVTDGLSADDLADYPSWDTWHDGASPREGAIACLEAQDSAPQFAIDQLEEMTDDHKPD